jgi:hypothetical protein
MPSPLRLLALTFDSNDPLALARFWAEAVPGDVRDELPARVVLAPAADDIAFELRFVPRAGSKTAKNPVHLDLTTTSVEDRDDVVERLLAAGASHLDIGQGPDATHVVLADPEGNELCVIEPTNNFLAGRPRIGSITCDGSRDVGVFWSRALSWLLFWDHDGETAIRSADGSGPFVTWGPPVPPVGAPSRLHLELVTTGNGDPRAEEERLLELGATRIEGEPDDAGEVALADPDGRRFVLHLRHG